MKIIFDHCSQPRAYADSIGKCLVLVEEGEDIEAIKAEFHKPKEWYQRRYSFDKQLTEYVEKKYDGDITHTGTLLLFDTYRAYLD